MSFRTSLDKDLVCHWCGNKFKRRDPMDPFVVITNMKRIKFKGHKKCNDIMATVLLQQGRVLFKNTRIVGEVSDR